MFLSELADEYLGTEYQDLISSGPFSERLYRAIGNETRTQPLIATIFWRTFVASPAFSRVLSRAGASRWVYIHGEKYVVQHQDRWDLIVFDPQFEDSPGFLFGNGKRIVVDSVEATPEDFRIGSRKAQDYKYSVNQTRYLGFDSQIAMEALNSINFALMIVPQPRIQYTGYVPHPAMEIAVEGTRNRLRLATVGIIATDFENEVGVTTALHAIDGESDVKVDTLSGKVKSIDPITDSCFITVPGCPNSHIRNLPLTGMTPRRGERVNFEGITSGSLDTVVTAWSPELPTVIRGSQAKLLTPPVTQPGDSGSALVDTDGKVLGFAFYRTGFEEEIEFSSWIWAESVFQAHQLR